MSAEKTAIIHAGVHKTASSSIQYTLAKNRGLLERHGFWYPTFSHEGTLFYNQSIPLAGLFMNDAQSFQHYSYHNNVDADKVNGEIEEVLRSASQENKNLVLSDEFISSLSVDELQKLKRCFESQGYSLRVIVFIREPLALMTSQIQQRVRRESIERQAARDRTSARGQGAKIRCFQQVFSEAVEFHSFEVACSHDKGPAGFLVSLLDIPTADLDVVQVNEGMSHFAVELIGFLSGRYPMRWRHPHSKDSKKTIHPLRNKDDYQPLSGLPGPKFRLSEAILQAKAADLHAERQEIEALLGDGFLPPTQTPSGEATQWGASEIDFIRSASSQLNLVVLIAVLDYFYAGQKLEKEARRSLAMLETETYRRIQAEVFVRSPLKGIASDMYERVRKFLPGWAVKVKTWVIRRR